MVRTHSGLRTLTVLALSGALAAANPAIALAQAAKTDKPPADAPASTTASAPAKSEKERRDEARALADQANVHFEAGEYQKAIELLHQADSIFHAPTLVIMQGHAQKKLGNLIEARALYMRVVKEGLDPNATEPFKAAYEEAKALADQLIGKTGYLKILLSGEIPPEKVQITIDDLPIPPSRIGQPIEQNPGKRKLVATIDAEEGGRQVFQIVTISPGKTKQIKLAFRKGAVKIDAEKTDDPNADIPDPEKEGSIVPAAVSFAVGGAGLIAGGVTGFLYLGKQSDIEKTCGGASECEAAKADMDSRKTLGIVSLAGLITGGLGLTLGTIFALTRKTADPPPPPSTSLFIGPSSIGVRGVF